MAYILCLVEILDISSVLKFSAGHFTFLLDMHNVSTFGERVELCWTKMFSTWGQNDGHWQ